MTNFNKKNRIGNNIRLVNSNFNYENKNILNSFNRSNSHDKNNDANHFQSVDENGINQNSSSINGNAGFDIGSSISGKNISDIILEKFNEEIASDNKTLAVNNYVNLNYIDMTTGNINKENNDFNYNVSNNFNNNKANNNGIDIDKGIVNESSHRNNRNLANFNVKNNNNQLNSTNNANDNKANKSELNSNRNNLRKSDKTNTRIGLVYKNDLDFLDNSNNKISLENQEQKIICGENILTNNSLNNYNSNYSNNNETKNTSNSNYNGDKYLENKNKITSNDKNLITNKDSNNENNSNFSTSNAQSKEKANYRKINNLNHLINLTNPNSISNNNNNNFINKDNNSLNNSPQYSTNSKKLSRFSKSKTRNDYLLGLQNPNINSTAIFNSSLILEMLNNMDMSKENINLSYKSIMLNSANLNNTFDIENLDSITEGKLLKFSLWENQNFIKAVKLLEFWLDIENSLDNKHFINNTFKRFFNYVKTEFSENELIENSSLDFFQINNLNKILVKIIKLLVFISAILYVIHQNFSVDASLKGQMKKLANSLSNPLLNFFEFLVFNNKKCLEKIIEGSYAKPDFLDKYNKLLKLHKISKGTKAPEALINIIKNLDSCLLIIKQFSKYFF